MHGFWNIIEAKINFKNIIKIHYQSYKTKKKRKFTISANSAIGINSNEQKFAEKNIWKPFDSTIHIKSPFDIENYILSFMHGLRNDLLWNYVLERMDVFFGIFTDKKHFMFVGVRRSNAVHTLTILFWTIFANHFKE